MPYKLIPPAKRRGRTWYVRGTVAGTRFEYATGKTDRQEAEKWALNFVKGLEGDALSGNGPITFTAACEAFIDFRKPRKADEQWIRNLSKRLGSYPVSEIRHAHLVETANALFPKGSAATKNRQAITPAAAVLHYAAEQGWCEYRRFKRYKTARRSNRQPAKDQDMALLLANTEGHRHALLSVLYETGLRISDVLRLREGDIDATANRLLVSISKTDERASLAISQTLADLLAALPKPGGRLFPWAHRWSVYKWLKPLCKKLKITYTPHMSRHALASDLLAQGVPDKAAAEAGAWRDTRSLQRYQHVRPQSIPSRNVRDLKGERAIRD
jgi:integrase